MKNTNTNLLRKKMGTKKQLEAKNKENRVLWVGYRPNTMDFKYNKKKEKQKMKNDLKKWCS